MQLDLGKALVERWRAARPGTPADTGANPAQTGIRIFEQMHPGTAVYNLAYFARHEGALDRTCLAEAVTALVARHPALRTVFPGDRADTAVVVPDPGALDDVVQWEDLRHLDADQRERTARDRAREIAAAPFDLDRAPLLRVRVYRTGDDRQLLLFVAHHLVCDGGSLGVAMRELGELYAGRSLPAAPAVTVPAPDPAHLEFWCAQLADLPALELPTDFPRGSRRTFAAHSAPVEVDAALVAAARRLAEEENATLFMVLLAAHQLMLADRSGQHDFGVGVPFAGRAVANRRHTIALATNPLVLRADLSGDPDFRTLVRRVRDTALAAFAHGDTPVEDVTAALAPNRDRSRSALFDTYLVFHGDMPAHPRLGTGEVVPERLDRAGIAQDVEMHLWLRDGALWGSCDVSADLFTATSAHRLVEHYRAVLTAALNGSRRPISTLDLLTPGDHEFLRRHGQTAAIPGTPRLLHQLVEDRARRTPAAVAVEHAGRRMTYRQLAERAGQVASYLRRQGAGPDTVVGVQMPRTPDLIAAVLGILRAGAAYLPLDPRYPATRVDFMREDSRALLVLTELGEEVDSQPARPPAVAVDPANLAYVIYTSGSTGRPKGVMMTHANAVGLIDWALRAYPDGDLDRVLAATSICFDLSVFEIFAPLAAGGTVVLVDDALALLREPAPPGITLLNTVPSAARELVAAGAVPASVRTVNLAGEALPGVLARQLYDTGSVRNLYNLYGPSETTTYSTGARLAPDDEIPPIGAPLPGERVLVLGPDLRPVPVGAIGELYIGGIGVGRGYLHRPGLTASRYLPDPAHPGQRLYRTGDLVRYRPDGELVYLGRRDNQVKLRGFRIELGEIEAQLTRHPRVQEAAVTVHRDQLVAYVTGDPAPEEGALAEYLRAELPPHLVPRWFVTLGALPRTPNGKLDRNALPQPAVREEFAGEAPQTVAEKLVADVWCEVLGLDTVSRDDDFFALGGHSLLASRAITRLRERTGTELSLATLFEFPTLAAYAATLSEPAQTPSPRPTWGPAERSVRADGTRWSAASAGERRLWFLTQLDLSANAGYVTQAALRLTGPLDVTRLDRALTVVAQRQESLRTTFAEVDGVLHRVVHPEPGVHVEVVPADDGRDLDRIAADAAGPYDLTTGPLLRVQVVALPAEQHLLLLSIHHIISDGWSLAVLSDELSEAYAAASEDRDPCLPHLPAQYADYAAWLEHTAAADTGARSYWSTTLAGLPELALPGDRAGDRGGHHGGRVPVALPAEVVIPLAELAQLRGATLNMALLALWEVLVGRFTGQHDFGIGTVAAGRPLAEHEPLIGFFANTLVHRADLTDRPDLLTLIDRVREQTLTSLAHQYLPYDEVVQVVGKRRAANRSPLYRVSFVFQNTPPARLRLPGVRAEPVPVAASVATADLGLSLWPGDDGGVTGYLQYADDIFDAATVRRLAQVLLDLLTSAVAAPQAPVHSLAVRPAERPAEVEPAAFLTDTVAGWARTQPDAVAISWDGGTMTYAELDRRSNQTAHWLRTRGVTHERVVGVDLARTGQLFVSLLGIWKAGGAFLALSAEIPAQRREYMLADSATVLVLTDDLLAGAAAQIDAAPVTAPDVVLRRNGLCHVAYTSGSTGRPKGVLAEHAQLLGFLAWATPYFMDGGRGAPLPSAITFDLSFAAMFAPLMSGDTVFVLRLEDPPINTVPAALAEGGFSFVKMTPAHLAVLDDVLPDERLPQAARRLVVAGEALTYRHVSGWARHAPDTVVVNEYGPTETVVGCVKYEFRAGTDAEGPVPIGQAAPGTRLLVLDRDLDPVVPGGVGELYIGGVQVSRGYLNQPGMTARVFLPEPGADGSRMYRTGDLVRELPDGDILFLGRRDDQIKLRGYRIELGEIENVLSTHPGVAQAAVAVRGSGDGRMLVAYVVGAEGDAAAIRAHLRERLPEHMVPAHYVFLPALPLRDTGKVDRAALPDPAAAAAPGTTDDTGHTASVLPEVAGIWRDLLHRSDVRPDSDFFDLGGHSLLATQLVARLRRAGYPDASVRQVFEHPTLAALAGALTGGREQAARPAIPVAPRRPGPEGTRIADASYGQQRLWLLSQMDERANEAYVIQGVLRLDGHLNADLFDEAVRTVVRRHEVLRTTFRVTDDRVEQVIHALPRVSVVRTELAGEHELPKLARRAASGFDLESGPLLRVHLARLGDDLHLLVLSVHHIVADGWSLAALSREVGVAYRALTTGETPRLPELAVQYSDFAHWQTEQLRGAEVAQRLDRIRDRLSEVPALELRTDLPRPSKPSFRGLLLRRHVPAKVMQAVRAVGAARSASPFMVLLAAFALLMRRHSNQCDFAVGIPVAGRTEAELEPLIGYFINTVVVRMDLRDEQSFTDLVDHVREAALEAYADQNVPFERTLEVVSPERDLSRTPIFQVMFNYLNQPDPELSIPGLDVRIADTDRQSAKLDLELYAADTADGGLDLALCASEDLFLPDTTAALLDHLLALIEQAGTAPEHALCDISVPGPDRPAPARTRETPVAGTVGERFAARARRDPDHLAVWTPGESLSYGELDDRARRLASTISAALPEPGRRIGVLCEQGVDVPVALLGVLAAGKAYVPLAPSAPRRWQENVIRLAGLDAIVADPANAGAARELAGGRPVIETVAPPGTVAADWAATDPDDVAYVLFTSGSTGTPKAVLQNHRRLLHHAEAYADAVGLGPRDRTTLLSAHTFDAAVLDLFGALVAGATVCPLDLRGTGVEAVRAALAAGSITVHHSTPTVFRLLAAAPAAEPWPSSLRAVVFGGEEVRPSDVALVRDSAAQAHIVNLYGCTECSIVAIQMIEPGEPMPRRAVPIGQPVLDTAVQLRDERGRPAESFGEICVVGRYLSVGYLDDRQTAAAYENTGEVSVYRTGDLAWRLPDGRLEFAGRRDEQIKVRGHRIEPGQVESQLRDQPGVTDAVVVPVTGPDGEDRLAAYIVGTADPARLQAQLHASLPHYMVPGLVIPLPALPATRTGKVDRKALPVPDWQAQSASEAPASPTEQAIAEVVAQVLGLSAVGRNDNFFALGGQSLQANQVAARLADRLGVDVPLRLLFEHPAVSALAAALDEAGRPAGGNPIPNNAHNTPIRPSARRMRERTTR